MPIVVIGPERPDELPEIRYAEAAGTTIAYQTFGAGPVLVVVPGLLGHLEAIWDIPGVARAYRELAAACRVVIFDKRGSGLSDRLPRDRETTLDERTEDVRAVMDAVGVQRAALFAQADGVPVACHFAATDPERVTRLVTLSGSARMLADTDYDVGLPAELADVILADVERRWGDGAAPALVDVLTPSRAGDPAWRRTLARLQRLSCTPAAARAQVAAGLRLDVRQAVAAVRAPALVLHPAGDRLYPVAQGRWLAAHLPDARYVELDHSDHLAPGMVVAELLEFLTGARPSAPTETALVTVLFTDIVNSTAAAVAAGDEEWGVVLDRHDAMTRRQLRRYGGREVKTTGDGFLATFTAPAGAIESACAIRDGATALGLEVRSGLHAGVVEIRGGDIGGTAVNVAARVQARAAASEVLVSRTVVELLAGSSLRFTDRGSHELKGVPGSWRLFAVE